MEPSRDFDHAVHAVQVAILNQIVDLHHGPVKRTFAMGFQRCHNFGPIGVASAHVVGLHGRVFRDRRPAPKGAEFPHKGAGDMKRMA